MKRVNGSCHSELTVFSMLSDINIGSDLSLLPEHSQPSFEKEDL